MDKQDWAGVAQPPAAVDHRSARLTRVIALNRVKSRSASDWPEILKKPPVAEADIHRRAAKDDQLRAHDDLAFCT